MPTDADDDVDDVDDVDGDSDDDSDMLENEDAEIPEEDLQRVFGTSSCSPGEQASKSETSST